MPDFGKPDATGRSSGKHPGRDGKIMRPPKGEPWVWHTQNLLISPAWKMHSINCVRLIDCLQIDHMNHAGQENGNLKATYDQLVAYGLSRSRISDAITEADFLGLIRCLRGGRWGETNQPSLYRLTYLPGRDISKPSNDWKRRSAEQIRSWRKERRRKKQARNRYRGKKDLGYTHKTTVVRQVSLRSVNFII